MTIINSLLRRLFDAALSPASGLHPLVGIAVVSLLFGVVMLLVFKWTSNQDKMAAVKRRIHAGLFEIRLFNDDLRAILRAIGAILWHNVSYVSLTIVPLLWMIVPLFLSIAQLQFHYGYQGLDPGDQALVKIVVEDTESRPPIRLETPQGLAVEAGPIWIPAKNELDWRIKAVDRGDYELSFVTGAETVTKSVRVTDRVVRISPNRVAKGFVDQLLYPAEDPLPESTPIREITVGYQAGNAGFEGWENELTWMAAFFLLSVVFALILRKPLKVTI
jgi:uncharacterized membrane protein (DUF106 family)